MMFTIYLLFSNKQIIKKSNIKFQQIRDILDILKAGDVSFKYCVRKETNKKICVRVKKVSHEQLKNKNLIFKLV